MGMYTWVQLPLEAGSVGSSGAGAPCGCEPPDTHARNWPWVLCQSWATSLASHSHHFTQVMGIWSQISVLIHRDFANWDVSITSFCIQNNHRQQDGALPSEDALFCELKIFTPSSKASCAHLLSKASGWCCSDRSGWTMWMTVWPQKTGGEESVSAYPG